MTCGGDPRTLSDSVGKGKMDFVGHEIGKQADGRITPYLYIGSHQHRALWYECASHTYLFPRRGFRDRRWNASVP